MKVWDTSQDSPMNFVVQLCPTMFLPVIFNILCLLPPAAGLTPPKSASVKWSLRSCWWRLVPDTVRTDTALLPESAAAARAGKDPSAESVGAFTSSPRTLTERLLHAYEYPGAYFGLLFLLSCSQMWASLPQRRSVHGAQQVPVQEWLFWGPVWEEWGGYAQWPGERRHTGPLHRHDVIPPRSDQLYCIGARGGGGRLPPSP